MKKMKKKIVFGLLLSGMVISSINGEGQSPVMDIIDLALVTAISYYGYQWWMSSLEKKEDSQSEDFQLLDEKTEHEKTLKELVRKRHRQESEVVAFERVESDLEIGSPDRQRRSLKSRAHIE